jgi:hypothetical protein
MIINTIYENQNLLSLYFVSFLVGLRTYKHPCSSNTTAAAAASTAIAATTTAAAAATATT